MPEAVTVVVEETHPLPEVRIHTIHQTPGLFTLGSSHPSDALSVFWGLIFSFRNLRCTRRRFLYADL